MKAINPQYINDAKGEKSLVVLPVKEFEALMEELEELEDIRLYDKAKKENDSDRVLFDVYLESRKKKDA